MPYEHGKPTKRDEELELLVHKFDLFKAIVRNDFKLLKAALSERKWETDFYYVICYAAESGCDKSFMQELLNYGWKPDLRHPQFWETPLMRAASNGNAEAVETLLAAGADPKAVDDAGHNALSASMRGKSRGHLRSMTLLMDAGCPVESGTIISSLMSAMMGAQVEMIEELIRRGADVNRVCPGGTPLTFAISEKRADVVALLLQYGADPNYRVSAENARSHEWVGLTALEIAKLEKLKKIVDVLERHAPRGAKQSSLPKSRPKPADVPQSWQRIEQELDAQGAKVKQVLKPGAKPAAFKTIEALTKKPLPKDVVESWQLHDGLTIDTYLFRVPGASGEFSGDTGLFRLLPLSEAVREAMKMRKFVKDGVYQGHRIDSEPGIAAKAWHDAWLPLAINMTGDLCCLDSAPTKRGNRGQIILVSSESPIRTRVAPSWSAVLQELEVVGDE